VLSLLKRKPKPPALVEPAPAEPVEPQSTELVRRDRQQNIKVSEDCSSAFAALAKAQGICKAALFEDMVAERLAIAERQGMKLRIE
jgi:hypothetical protein